MNQVDFVRAPAPGLEVRFDGVEFVLIGHEAHVRRDGSGTVLLVWSSRCTACQAPFVTRTGLQARSITKRCEQHRQRGVPATDAAAIRMFKHRRRFAMKGKS